MAWTFDWLLSWEEVWSGGNVARWSLALAPPSNAVAVPFMHPSVVRAWLESVGGADEYQPYFMHASDPAGQAAYWPLLSPKRRSLGGVRRLAPAGSGLPPYGAGGLLFDYHDPILVPAAGRDRFDASRFWPDLHRELQRCGWCDVLSVGRLREGRAGPLPEGTAGQVAPFLDLAAYRDFDAYLAARKPKVRETLRRRLRRAEVAGRVELHVYGAGDAAEVLHWLPRLESEMLRRHDAPCRLPDGYLRRLADGLGNGVAHFSALKIDGVPISWMIGFVLGGVYSGYVRAFDPEAAQLSPGVVHFCRLADRLIADGVREIDFGLGAETYKYELSDGAEHRVGSLTLKNRSLTSLARRSTASAVWRGTRVGAAVRAAFGGPGAERPAPGLAGALTFPARRPADG